MKNKKSLLSCFIIIFAMMVTLKVYAADTPLSKRIAGNNRYSTAVEISKSGWQTSNTAIVATGENFPDALCAAPLAKQLDAPILLTEKNTLNANTSLELTRLKVNKVHIIGGPGVVSDAVKKQIESKGIICERIFGNNRYATSIEVAKHLNVANKIVVATGDNFPDALSIAPIAAKNGMPIILTDKTNIPEVVKTYINSKNITKSYIIGGTGVITDNVKGQLPFPDRIYGANRYETNVAILNRFNNELNFATSYLATGNDFPDALAGSALAPKSMSPIILTDKIPSTVTKNYVLGKLSLITSLNALGGTGVIPDNAISSLLGILYTYGNTSGNLTNGGSEASDGQYIYYHNSSDGHKLYKHKLDGSSKSKISDSICSSLNIVGDWIYYSVFIGDTGIYKMKKDGSSKIRIVNSQTMGIAVVNDWIYYLEREASESQINNLYKIKTDGTSKTKINLGVGDSFICIDVQDVVVIEDWVYLSLVNKAEKTTQLCRIKTDGSIAQRVLSSHPRFFSIEDGWIYYADETYRKLKKTKVDGSSEVVLYTIPDSDYYLYSINVSKGYVYFTNKTESQSKDKLGIYKMKTDGSELAQLLSGSAKFLNIVSDWIYFEAPGNSTISYSDGQFKIIIGGSSQTLKLKTDGSQLLKVD
jgi:putative cell wall-binding protein